MFFSFKIQKPGEQQNGFSWNFRGIWHFFEFSSGRMVPINENCMKIVLIQIELY